VGKELEESIVNDILLPGIYKKEAALLCGWKEAYLSGTSSDTWIIRIGAAFSSGGNIELTEGALSSCIQWVCGYNCTINSSR
jgi:hypothetical protein